ncbi:MAG: hypothetical protein Q8O70_12530, partial [Burkholderiales bacterium]|nr:hypothetical protein [Burkholderiales bacterium]
AATATPSENSGPAAPPATVLSVHTVDSAEPPSAELAPRRAPVPSAAPRLPPGANPDGTRARSAGIEPESRSESVPANAVEQLRQRVISFARLTGVADCLHFTGGTACGYYMEPPQTPLDLEPDQSLRRWAWWLLALLCGQMSEDVSRRLPDTSDWRRLCLCEDEDECALPLLLENELAGPVNLDVMLTDWLADPADEAATLFCEILTLVRRLRAAMPQRDSMPEDGNRPAMGE